MLSGRFPMNSIPHPPFLHDERHDLLDDDRNLYCQGEPERLERHMGVNREKAAENRERIVEAAARLFREQGFDGVGVDAIMKEAGLTHGGFYGHFASKEELATEAITRAFAQGSEKLGHCSDLGGLVNAYLSDAHCADRSEGCALAALSADIAREGKGVRHALTEDVVQRLA